MRVRREWVWVVVLVITIMIAVLLTGCARRTEEQLEKYYEDYFIEIEYKGHTYIVFSRNDRMGLTHAAHCKRRH